MPLEGKQQLIAKLRRNADKFCRAIGLETQGRLMRRTPVDTGRARANWNVGIGAPVREADDSLRSADVGARQAEGQQVIAQFGAGERLFVTNGLPYIPALEDGHSKQAPQGMVKITAAEMQRLSERAAAKILREDG